ncbi:MAG: Holliday junction resolvase RecU [Bacilli bacterium]
MNIKTNCFKNRGMFLENIINETNLYYRQKDTAIIYKKPTPIKVIDVKFNEFKQPTIEKAVFDSISQLDYCGIYKSKYIEFDAKECKNTTSFPLNNIKTHQLEHMKDIIRHGGITFLIIFMNNNFFLLKGEDIIDFINENSRKSIDYNYLKDKGYKIEEKFTPRLDYIKQINEAYFKEKRNEEI